MLTISKRSPLKDRLFPYILLLPVFLIAGTVLFYPLLNSIYISFTDYTIISPSYNFVGFKNYLANFRDVSYWGIWGNSILIIVCAVFVQLSFGLIMALLLDNKFKMRNIFKSSIFIIWVIPEIAVALLWLLILNSDFGILNYIIRSIGLVDELIYWRGEADSAKLALIMVYSWRGIPFFMVMILAALQTIPLDIIDASSLDGLNFSQYFRYIILPYIKDILIMCFLLSIVRLFQDITQIDVLTSGGPGYGSTTIAYQVYRRAFSSFETSNAASIGVTWLLFLSILAVFYIRMMTRNRME